EEIAKLRAARRMWARIMKDRFGARNPKSMMLRTHAQTAGASLTAQQPTNTIDPFGGSYAVEALTDRMEREANDYIRRIDDMGGMVKAIETGYPQREIAEAAFHFQRQLEQGIKT